MTVVAVALSLWLGPAPAEPAPATDAAAGFFDPEATAPPMPEIEDLPSRDPDAAPTEPAPVEPAPAEPTPTAPPMPEIEDLPSQDPDAAPAKPPVEDLPPQQRRGVFDVRPPSADREPAGVRGGSFFDPGKLDDDGPSGGAIQIRGFVAAAFFVTERTNTRARDGDGNFERLSPSPFFDVTSATLYVGAPVFSDVVYARIALEYISIPQQQVSAATPDIISQANRQLFFESAALEINPLTWAKRSPEWFRHGFKITGGVFIVPFGLEDESHAAPANAFASRPRSMTTNRVYPGTWTDAGVMLKWKPTFDARRPIEIDVGFVNGDPCTQTRFVDRLYLVPGAVIPTCERVRRPGELDGETAGAAGGVRIDSGFFGIAPDNNNNKSIAARVQVFPLPALNFGGSFVWGKHPDGSRSPDAGETTVDLEQAASWRAGGHVDLDLDQVIQSPYPLPQLRGEVVYGVDASADEATLADRAVLGGYAQITQALFRRKKTRLPGLFVQYRFDHADPDLAVPGRVDGVPLLSDFSNAAYPGESLLQGHTVALRFPALPRFSLKAEYTFFREDGGRENQLYNDLFAFQVVADF